MENKQRVKLKCQECGKEFELYPCQMKRGRGQFCSRKCANDAQRHGCKIKCVMCGKLVYRRFGEQDLHTRKNQFCSKECYFQYRKVNAKPKTYLKNGSRHVHRIIAENILNRPLEPQEVVHHIDGNPKNNEPSNIAILSSQAEHAKIHFGRAE